MLAAFYQSFIAVYASIPTSQRKQECQDFEGVSYIERPDLIKQEQVLHQVIY